VIEPPYRASATGLMLSCAFLVGAVAPVLMGWMKGSVGLNTSISALGIVYGLAGVVVLIAIKTTFTTDYRLEATPLAGRVTADDAPGADEVLTTGR
jgi:hypothetical protein